MSDIVDMFYCAYTGCDIDTKEIEGVGRWDNKEIEKAEDALGKRMDADNYGAALDFACLVGEHYFRKGFEIGAKAALQLSGRP